MIDVDSRTINVIFGKYVNYGNTYGIKHIYNRMNRFIVFHLSLIVWFCHTNVNKYMHMIHIN